MPIHRIDANDVGNMWLCHCYEILRDNHHVSSLPSLQSEFNLSWHGGGDIPCQGEDVTDSQAGHALPGLHGGAPDVREDDDIRAGKQRAAGGQWLRGADIKPSSFTDIIIIIEVKEMKDITFNAASVEGGDESLLVHQAAPGDVDQEGGALHVGQELRTDNLVRLLAEAGGHHHDVRHGGQLVETDPGDLRQQPETELRTSLSRQRALSYLAASSLSLLLE